MRSKLRRLAACITIVTAVGHACTKDAPKAAGGSVASTAPTSRPAAASRPAARRPSRAALAIDALAKKLRLGLSPGALEKLLLARGASTEVASVCHSMSFGSAPPSVSPAKPRVSSHVVFAFGKAAGGRSACWVEAWDDKGRLRWKVAGMIWGDTKLSFSSGTWERHSGCWVLRVEGRIKSHEGGKIRTEHRRYYYSASGADIHPRELVLRQDTGIAPTVDKRVNGKVRWMRVGQRSYLVYTSTTERRTKQKTRWAQVVQLDTRCRFHALDRAQVEKLRRQPAGAALPRP